MGYQCRVEADLYLYLCLVKNKYQESFVMEIAWNRCAGYPEQPALDDPFDFGAESRNFRLSCLSTSGNREKQWVIASGEPGMNTLEEVMDSGDEKDMQAFLENDPLGPVETAIKKIPAVVADAVDNVVRDVCPYFERLAAELGCLLPWQVEANNVDKGAGL